MTRSASRDGDPRAKRNRRRSRSQSSDEGPGDHYRHSEHQRSQRGGEERPRDNGARSRRDGRRASRSPHRRRHDSRSSASEDERRRRRRQARRDEDHGTSDRRSGHHRHHHHRSSHSHRTRPESGKSRSRSRSPPGRTRHDSRRSDEPRRRADVEEDGPPDAVPEKEQPNFARSGKLAAETNRVAGTGIVLKYNEPAEARLPSAKQDWRMYEFKDGATVSTTELGSRSCWLVGREAAVAHFLVAHPSCSGQHAVLQFRYVERTNEYGDRIGKVKLYVLDLESANGTTLNGVRIEDSRFVEVQSGDMLKFGESTREYVILLA